MRLIWILSATILVSLCSLIGAVALLLKERLTNHLLIPLIGLSAGALIGGAFIHLIPEAFNQSGNPRIGLYTLIGFVCFFLLERYFHWRHCHKGICEVHPMTYLNLVGDGFHNFIDGLVIAAAFLVSIKLGVITTLAIALHEIPQELGDFGLLVYGGFGKGKALTMNFIFSLTALIGALLGYFLGAFVQTLPIFLLPFTAGGFIYIAASDLIPELHRQPDIRRANLAIITFLLGILIMWLAGMLHA